MDIKQIVIMVFVLLVVVYLIINAFSKTSKLSEMADGTILNTILSDKLKNASNSSNFTYSMWIYVNDWNYRYGSEKVIMSRNGGPNVVLDSQKNQINVKVKYYSTGAAAGAASPPGISTSNCAKNASNATACKACNDGFTCACKDCDTALYTATTNAAGVLNSCTPLTSTQLSSDQLASAAASGAENVCAISNIPLQKWTNVVISLYGQTLDTYLDGKLVRTCILPGIPNIDNTKDVLITPGGGFKGWTANFKYWASASNPQDVYNIYKDGYGGSILGNIINKYKLRFIFLTDNVENGSFEI